MADAVLTALLALSDRQCRELLAAFDQIADNPRGTAVSIGTRPSRDFDLIIGRLNGTSELTRRFPRPADREWVASLALNKTDQIVRMFGWGIGTIALLIAGVLGWRVIFSTELPAEIINSVKRLQVPGRIVTWKDLGDLQLKAKEYSNLKDDIKGSSLN